MEQKSNNNNNDTHKFAQLSLSGEKMPIFYSKLRGFHAKILETFYENKHIALCQSVLFSAWGEELHPNTINNFIKSAIARGWICRLKPIEGATINSVYMSYKEPDYLPTGQKVSDKRYKYYIITSEGIRVFELNRAYNV